MPNTYKEMYFSLSENIATLILCLQSAHIETEEIFISADEADVEIYLSDLKKI